MSLTHAQKRAVSARGNVLVVAGAGTGKTTTLVERCLDCLLSESPPAALDEILMVTFTEAAAAEMRQRIRLRLLQESERHPDQPHWQEQLALFETAQIGTLHSFCLQLVRQHFYELELDPQLTVLPEAEARLQADEVLEQRLQRHYAGRDETAAAVRQLIQAQGRGWDQPLRRLVLRLHHYTQTLPNPAAWIQNQLALFDRADPLTWKQWRARALAEWRDERAPGVHDLAPANPIAARCLALLDQLQSVTSEPERASILQGFAAAARDCPAGKKTLWLYPLEHFLAEAAFQASVAAAGDTDPLVEDWNWVRSPMRALLGLVREFAEAFCEAKRELGVLDFHDLEQYALRLLWDPRADQPTPIANEWRQKLRFIFVDEYQDINAAQDKILQALSRDGPGANRFLVGDVKQSIYRFRQANPYIFRRYLETWGNGQGTALPLVGNFRSREALLNFINDFFAQIMRLELGGVAYDETTKLQFGAPAERAGLSVAASTAPRVEMHWRLKSQTETADADPDDPQSGTAGEVVELEEAAKEARLVGLRLLELKSERHPVWDEALQDFRPLEWRDVALLLRAPANKSESYAKEFARLEIPLELARRGFYQTLEISDLVNLLQILDNPLQDIPVLAVLHSPLVGLTPNELAEIRLALPKGYFWNAVVRWTDNQPSSAGARDTSTPKTPGLPGRRSASKREPNPTQATAGDAQQLLDLSDPSTPAPRALLAKLTTFLERYNRWRRLVRQVSLSRCLETVLAETYYVERLLTQPHGEQRRSNVQRLLAVAERFNQFQRQGLFRFLRFIETQQAAEAEPEVTAVTDQDAVRLMSIHQSKGLEFPVVVLADLAKPFNRMDLNADIILDEELGLCPLIQPPHTGKRYPSLPYWLARRRQTRELLGEELRLLYVGMTRARDTLILSASLSVSRLSKVCSAKLSLSSELLRSAQSYADWLAWWFALNCGPDPLEARQGQTQWLHWAIYDETRLAAKPVAAPNPPDSDEPGFDSSPGIWHGLQQRLAWRYRWQSATQRPAKTSVSALRRHAVMNQEETAGFGWTRGHERRFAGRTSLAHSKPGTMQPSAAELGVLHHKFLQLVALDKTESPDSLRQEAARLQSEGLLTAEEAVVLDCEAIAAFWGSDLGRKMRAQPECIRRELPFTARFSPNELARFSGDSPDPVFDQDQEFVVVQGIADLALILPEEIWIVDFKTDEMKPADIEEKVRLYRPQLWVYAQALSRTYARPVSQSWLYFLALRRAVPLEVA